MREYKVIVTTIKYPKGVSYPPSGHPLYTRAEAIQVMRKLQSQGHSSDFESTYGTYAESETDRFTLDCIQREGLEKILGLVGKVT